MTSPYSAEGYRRAYGVDATVQCADVTRALAEAGSVPQESLVTIEAIG